MRRIVQFATLLLALIIPVSGLFRIDPVAGAFIVLDRQIWFSDFFLVVGLWLAISSCLVMTYSLVGTAFCGWMCPQNTFSEWANYFTQRLLGKRAEISLEGEPIHVSAGKKKWLNWVLLFVIFLSSSAALALIPLLYFYKPEQVWSFITFAEDANLASSLYWIYSVFVLIILIDIALIRHFWCRFMCIYRVWQHSFKTKQTLHITHQKDYLSECKSCNYCVTKCIVEIDPRMTDTFDSCINCGECITACDSIRQARKTGTSLLHFELGERTGALLNQLKTNVGSFVQRVSWTAPLAVMGILMFVWGLVSYQPYHFSVYRDEISHGDQILDYRINLANKLYKSTAMEVWVENLPDGSFVLSDKSVEFATAGRKNLFLKLSPDLPAGLYSFYVHVESTDGWRDVFRVQHFVASE